MRSKIVIQSQRLNYSVNVDSQTKEFRIDGYNIDSDCESFVKNVISIVKDWPEKIENNNESDTTYLRYVVAYDDGCGEVRKLEGEGSSPDNFGDLIILINDAKDLIPKTPYEKLKSEFFSKDIF